MKNRRAMFPFPASARPAFPIVSLVLAAATLITSLAVAQAVNGSVFSTVKIVDLALWGGVTFADMRDLKLWKLATAQLVHVKPMHMAYNVVCLGWLGFVVEKKVCGLRVFIVWLLAGGIATLISPVFVAPPFNVGTGASQAVLAFAGCALALSAAGQIGRFTALLILALAILPAFALDLIYAGYPKIGHAAALVLGASLGGVFRPASERFFQG